jgi:transcriptional regulator with XRE-family HTH domain
MARPTDQKLFLGGRLKRLRRDLDLSQTGHGGDLGVSPSYLNHIERNQRPVSAQLLLRLAETYDVDLRLLGQTADAASTEALARLFADPVFKGLSVPRHEVVALADDHPAAAEALTRLYKAFSDQRARAQTEAERGGAGLRTPPPTGSATISSRAATTSPRSTHWAKPFTPNWRRRPAGAGPRATSAPACKVPPRSQRPHPAGRGHGRMDPALDLHRRRLLLSEALSALRRGPLPSSISWSCRTRRRSGRPGRRRPPPRRGRPPPAQGQPDQHPGRRRPDALRPVPAHSAEETGYDLGRLQQRFGVSSNRSPTG